MGTQIIRDLNAYAMSPEGRYRLAMSQAEGASNDEAKWEAQEAELAAFMSKFAADEGMDIKLAKPRPRLKPKAEAMPEPEPEPPRKRKRKAAKEQTPPPAAAQATKICSRCKAEKPVEEFYYQCRYTGRRQSICKVCSNEAKRASLERQREAKRQAEAAAEKDIDEFLARHRIPHAAGQAIRSICRFNNSGDMAELKTAMKYLTLIEKLRNGTD